VIDPPADRFHNGTMRRSTKEESVSFTIKDMRRSCLSKLGRLAAAEARSLNRQIIHILEQAAEATTPIQASPRRQVEAWRALAGLWVSDRAPAEEARLMMARRSGRRKTRL